jgi:hypothetical protein
VNPFRDGEGVTEAGKDDGDRPRLHGARARIVTLEISLASVVLAGRQAGVAYGWQTGGGVGLLGYRRGRQGQGRTEAGVREYLSLNFEFIGQI